MTTIAMRLKGHKLEIAFDSQATDGARALELKQSKVFEVGGFLIGFSGGVALLNAIKYSEYQPIAENVEQWVITYLAPKFRELNQALKKPEAEAPDGWEILVFIEGRLFYVGDDLSVIEPPSGLYSIGSGSSYCLGALTVGASALEAVEAAAAHDIYTGGTLHTLDLEYFETVRKWVYGPLNDQDRDTINNTVPLKIYKAG